MKAMRTTGLLNYTECYRNNKKSLKNKIKEDEIMAMEITNNYNSVYESTYTTQKQQTSKQQVDSKTETKETAAAQNNIGTTTSNSDYFNKLAKLAPSVDCRIGTAYSSAKNGKTLTLNPKLLEKMQNDPEFEKEMMDMIKGVESMTKLSESINKATGWTIVYQHNYIDENGKFHHIGQYRNDFMYNMSDELREERKKNTEKLLEKTKEKAVKKKEELQEALEEKRVEKEEKKTEEEKTSKAEKLIKEKIAASKDGKIYMYDTDFKEIMEAMKEDKADTKKQFIVGANLDMQV